MSRPDAHFEGVARLDGADAALSKDGPMKETVAGPIRQFDEAKSLVGTEPLHDCSDGRVGG